MVVELGFVLCMVIEKWCTLCRFRILGLKFLVSFEIFVIVNLEEYLKYEIFNALYMDSFLKLSKLNFQNTTFEWF